MIISEIIKNMAKQLLITAIVIAISIAVMSVNETVGIILMMLYSSWMVVKSSNKEMPLNKFTALVPGIMSLTIFFIMLGLIRTYDGEVAFVGMGLGIIPGWLMARGHKIYKKNGLVYAKRTFFYVLIWALSILLIQGSTLLGMREVTGFSSLLNGFSTAMMVVLSIILFMKTYKNQGNLTNKSVGLFITISFLMFSSTQVCQAEVRFSINGKGSYTMQQTGNYIVGKEVSLLPSGKITKKFMGNSNYFDLTLRKFVYSNSGTSHASLRYKLRYADTRYGGRSAEKELNEKVKSLEKTYRNRSQQKTSCGPGALVNKILLKNDGNGIYLSSRGKCDGRYQKHYWVHVNVIWQYVDWFFQLEFGDSPYTSNTLLGPDYERYIKNSVHKIQERIKDVKLIDNVKPKPTPQLDPKPIVSDSSSTSSSNSQSSESSSFADVVSKLSSDEYLKNLSFENWEKNKPNDKSMINPYASPIEFSDEIAIAGAIAALVMLLASFGLNASMLAAQETATVAMGASVAQEAVNAFEHAVDDDYSNEPYVRGTKMLEGAKAEKWMKDHGYIKDDKRPELFKDRLQDFRDSMPTEKAPGLQAWAGYSDKIGDYVIIVDDEKVQEPQKAKKEPTVTDDSSKKDDNTTTNSTDENATSGDTGSDPDDKKISVTSNQNTPKSTKSTTSKTPPPPIDYSHVKDHLEKVMDKIIKDKIDEGYYVRNPHHFEEIKDIMPGYHPIKHILSDFEQLNKAYNNSLGWVLNEKYGDYKGGQCGDYAKHGIAWSSKKIKELYGEDAIFDQIIVKSKLSPKYINHAATRVTLPNGDKYVIDYWEGIQNEEHRVYTEAEWIERHSKKLNTLWLGTETEIEVLDSASVNSAKLTHKALLDKYIFIKGEDEGKKLFLKYIDKNNRIDLPDAKKLVAQWRKNT